MFLSINFVDDESKLQALANLLELCFESGVKLGRLSMIPKAPEDQIFEGEKIARQ